MSATSTLQGWSAILADNATRTEAIERAFDYRGDVTVVCTDGRRITGYLYNRDGDVAEPFAQIYDTAGSSHTLRYDEIDAIVFSGTDMAAGKSYEAWLERRHQPRQPVEDDTSRPPVHRQDPPDAVEA
jgi:hypothetical protein